MDDDGLHLFTNKHSKYYRQCDLASSADSYNDENINTLNTDYAQVINAKGRFFDRVLPAGTIL